jgi:hypothetical protein
MWLACPSHCKYQRTCTSTRFFCPMFVQLPKHAQMPIIQPRKR